MPAVMGFMMGTSIVLTSALIMRPKTVSLFSYIKRSLPAAFSFGCVFAIGSTVRS